MSDDEEQYEFEYSDAEEEGGMGGGEEDDALVRVENTYYGSKGSASSGAPGDVEAALAGFKQVLAMEAEAGGGALAEWGFKATKQLVKLASRVGQHDLMLQYYG